MTRTTSSETERRRVHEQNRRSWNAITPIHNSHKRDQAEFFRRGGTTLFPDELQLLGDIATKRLVHLQCNCGQDSLSLARHTAQVTGVDISDKAIEFAQTLSRDSGIAASFVRSDLYDWFEQTDQRFDVVFTSYGTIGWLCDLARWARGVARILDPRGRLVFIEFHPIAWSLDARGLGGDNYFIDGTIVEKNGVNDYVGQALAPSGYQPGVDGFVNPEPGYAFQWTVADIVQHIVDAGLHIETLREYPYSNGCELFEGMRALPNRRYGMPEGLPTMPLMLGLVARTGSS